MVDYDIATEIIYYAGEDYPIMKCVNCSEKRKEGQMVPVGIGFYRLYFVFSLIRASKKNGERSNYNFLYK